MLTKEINIEINKATSICIRNNIKVYPVAEGSRFKIEVDNNGEKIRYSKFVSGKEINVAMTKTYKHFALTILKQQQDANSTKEN